MEEVRIVDPKLFFSDPDPTFQEILDQDPILPNFKQTRHEN